MSTHATKEEHTGLEIAIIGMACRFPGAENIDAFWRNIQQGVESISHFSHDELTAAGVAATLAKDASYVPARGILEGVEYFDADFFGYKPREAELMDPQYRLFLECAWEALERAGYNSETYPGLIGMYAGSATNSYLLSNIAPHYDPATLQEDAQIMLGNEREYLCTRVAYKLNLKGPALTVQSACSTSLVAAHLACQGLLNGECDMALAGGVSIGIPQTIGYLYQEGGIGSPDGHCRAFDARAQGTTFGNGLGLVVLKRLTDALADGDTIEAVIKGSAINNDGSTKVSFTAPGVEGQARVIRAAQLMAEVDASSITYVEAHGTGTPLGDPIEIAALTQAFRASTDAGGYCALGSVKTNIGHVNTAAGVAGLIKTVLALKYRVLPPSLHFEHPNPRIDLEHSPFYVNSQRREWSTERLPRRAGVSSFGIGGTNAHVILEEAPPSRSPEQATRRWQILTLSARTKSALEVMTTNLYAYLQAHPEHALADIAYTLHVGRKPLEYRRYLLCQDRADALRALEARDRSRLSTRNGEPGDASIVFMFPGQGSQCIHMAEELFKEEPVFREQVERCARLLAPYLRQNLLQLLYPQETEAEKAARLLAQTEYAQPALFVVEYALSQLWMAWGVRPQMMIGHSIGEYVAACLAGVFSLEEGLELVALRGQLMQDMPAGAMLALPLSEQDVRPYLNEKLWIAANNGPSRCVVAGDPGAITALEQQLATRDIHGRLLQTSHAFHSPMMEPVVEPLVRHMSKMSLREPALPYVSNLTGTWITATQATDPAYWGKHLLHTVRFTEGLQTLLKAPGCLLLEAGPGQSLSRQVKPLLAKKSGSSVFPSLPHSGQAESEALLKTAAELWLAGVNIDWSVFHSNENRQRLPLPTYPFERKRYWVEPPVSVKSTAIPQIQPIKETPKTQWDVAIRSKEHIMPETTAATRLTKIISLLQEIFGRLFGVDAAEIDPELTFLEMGADSLSLLQANQAIRDRFAVNVPFRLMLDEYPDIQSLANFLEEKLPAEALTEERESTPASDGQQAASIEAARSPDFIPPHAYNGGQSAPQVQAVAYLQPVPAALPSQENRAVPPSALEQILAQQLQVMRQQLEVLHNGHQGASSTPVPPANTSLSEVARPPASYHEQAVQNATTSTRPPGIEETQSPGQRLDPETFVPFRPRRKKATIGLTQRQQEHLDALIERYTRRTKESKLLAQAYRPYLADNKGVAGFRFPLKEVLYPIAVQRAQGATIWDVDGNKYVDTAMGYGSLLFGHSPSFITETLQEQIAQGIQIGPQSPCVGKVARLLCELTNTERATFCNSGTEAVMTALRLARAVTGRPKIALFAGAYHGTFDGVLVVPREGANSDGQSAPMAPGVPPHIVDDVLILRFNTTDSLDIIRTHAHELAAVLVEPRQSRRPDLQPVHYLHELRRLTQETGIALIFDEVVTGFRTHLGGVQGILNIQADITTYGKAMGGGIPVAAVAGKATFMNAIDGGPWTFGDNSYPEAMETFFAGTFFKHPLVMPVVWRVLNYLKEHSPALQEQLNQHTAILTDTLNAYFEEQRVPMLMVNFGSLFRFVFPPELKTMESEIFFYHLMEKGVYLAEGRNCFLSTAHTDEDIQAIIQAVRESVAEMRAGGFLQSGPGLSPTPLDDAITVPARRESSRQTAEHAPATSSASNAVADRNVGEVHSLPLTDGQKALWLLTQKSDAASCAYNESFTLDMRGSLDINALRAALQELVQRHEALRTTFSAEGSCQYILPQLTLAVPVIDFTQAREDEGKAQVSDWIRQEIARAFDLEHGPLLRAQILKQGECHHLLLLVYHHIIVDGWSISILLQELSELYSAAHRGTGHRLPAPMQFSEYATWLAQQKPTMAEMERYWLEQFSGPLPILELPTDHPRPPMMTYKGAAQRMIINHELAAQLKNLGAQQHCTFYATLLTGFRLLLGRLTGQTDIIVGISAAGQLLVGGKHLVGNCINWLPLRNRIQGDRTLADCLLATKRTLLDAYDHQIYPFQRLIEKLGIPVTTDRPPLISAVFNLDRPAEPGEQNFAGLTVDGVLNPVNSAKYDLTVEAIEVDEGIQVDFIYNADLFDARTIERWMAHFRTLLQSMVAANPEQPCAALTVFTDAERERLLREWNDTQASYPSDSCVHHLFEEQVERTPQAIAVISGDEQLSYHELNERANQLAHYLQTIGVGPEIPVGICMERSAIMMIGLLGILKAGGAYVPLDPAYPKERLDFIINDTAIPILLTQQRLLAKLPRERTVQALCLDTEWQKVSAQPVTNPSGSLTPGNTAYIIYTSGSTGIPKGAMIPHQGVVNYLSWSVSAYEVAVGKGAPVHSSLSFDLTMTSLFPPLLVGNTVVMLSEDQGIEALKNALRAGTDFSLVKLTPAHLRALELPCDRDMVGCARRFILGGEQLRAEYVRPLQEAVPTAWIVNEYGPTETTVGCCIYEIRPGQYETGAIPIGRPIANTQLYVLDESLQPVPAGVIGELYVGGEGLARGYLNQAALTAERFIPDPFARYPGGRLYRTGDLARYRVDGVLEFLGRNDRQTKIRGFRIEPAEIEAVLETHPTVREATVLVREDTAGERRLVAYVVEQPGQKLQPAILRDYLAGKLPDYMVPSHLVLMDALPLTTNGKVDRRALPAPERETRASEETAPSSALENVLASIWQEVLHIEKVGIHDNFLELGGDSITGIKVIARLQKVGYKLSPKQLFQLQTIARLAAELEKSAANGQTQASGQVPLTPIQRWFIDQPPINPHHFNQAVLLRVTQKLDPALLEQSIAQVVTRHDALRLRFVRNGDKWQQGVVEQAKQIPFTLVDLSTIAREEQPARLEARAAELQRQLNIVKGPIMQVALFDLGAEEGQRLLIVIHHIAVDIFSWRLLLEDVQTAYEQLSRGEAARLMEPTTSFKQWAEQLATYGGSQQLQGELDYWLTWAGKGMPRLPRDNMSGINTEGSARIVSLTLHRNDTQLLLQSVPKTYRCQVSDVLLATLVQVLAEWTGNRSCLIDLEGHGREDILPDINLARTVGWFTTLTPLYIELKAADDPAEALQLIKTHLRNLPHGGIGYGLLRYFSKNAEVSKQLAALSEAEVSFNYSGRSAQPLGRESLFAPATESCGPTRDPENMRHYLIEVMCSVEGEQLRMDWTYSEHLHERGTILQLAERFRACLRSLISPDPAADAQIQAPADLSLVGLNKQQWRNVLAKIRFGEDE